MGVSEILLRCSGVSGVFQEVPERTRGGFGVFWVFQKCQKGLRETQDRSKEFQVDSEDVLGVFQGAFQEISEDIRCVPGSSMDITEDFRWFQVWSRGSQGVSGTI